MASQYASPRVPNFGRGDYGQFSPYRDTPQGDPGQQDSQQSPLEQAIAPRGSQQPQQPSDYTKTAPQPYTDYSPDASAAGSRGINDGRSSYFPGAADGGITGGLYGQGSYTNQPPDQSSQSGGSDSGLGLMSLDSLGSAIGGGGMADFNLAQQLGIDTSNPLWRQILLQMMSQSQGSGQGAMNQSQQPNSANYSANPYMKFF